MWQCAHRLTASGCRRCCVFVCLQAEFENLLALFVRLCGDEIWGVRKVRARNRGCNNHSNNSRNDRGRSGDGSKELLFSTVSARSQLQACAEALPAVAVLVPAERRATEFAALFYAFTADVSRWVKSAAAQVAPMHAWHQLITGNAYARMHSGLGWAGRNGRVGDVHAD